MRVIVEYSGGIKGEEKVKEKSEKQITQKYKQKFAVVEFEDILNREVIIEGANEVIFENGKSARIENVIDRIIEFVAKYVWDEWVQYGSDGSREIELILDKDDHMDLYFDGAEFTVYYVDARNSWEKEIVGFAVKDEDGERVYLLKNHWYCEYKFFNSL